MTTTTRDYTLLLRLAAAELGNEPYSVRALRVELRRLGWADSAMDAATASVRAAVAGVGMERDYLELRDGTREEL